MLPGASGVMTMLLKAARRFLFVSIALAGLVTTPSTSSAAAFPVAISASTSSFVDSVQYAPDRRASNGPGCGYDGVFPCGASERRVCADGYGGVFPCSSRYKARRHRL
jgi:hypothetical protein